MLTLDNAFMGAVAIVLALIVRVLLAFVPSTKLPKAEIVFPLLMLTGASSVTAAWNVLAAFTDNVLLLPVPSTVLPLAVSTPATVKALP